ncbi:MAG: hypothetical protein WD276_05845 [Actinomycetota bacterium]
MEALRAVNRSISTPGLLATVLDENRIQTVLATPPLSPPLNEDRTNFNSLMAGINRDGKVLDIFAVGADTEPHSRLVLWDEGTDRSVNVVARLRGDLGRVRRGSFGGMTLIMILSPTCEQGTKRVLAPIVLAEGTGDTLFDSGRRPSTVSSDSTRQVGIVSNEDVAPTILDFFGVPIPAEMNGSVIDVVDQAPLLKLEYQPPPFERYERYLAQRRMYVPIGTGAGIAVTLFGFACVALIWLRRRVPRIARVVGPWLALATPALAIGLLAAGNLRTLNYTTVLPFVIGVTVVLPVAALTSRRNGVLRPPALLGAAVLVFFAAEALLGWPATLHTFIGGTALDGARFYGLPNVFIGLLLGSGLYLASVLRPYTGFVLLVGIGLFCGFPSLGANFGAAVTLFAAAGLWLALSPRRGFGIRGLAITMATVVAGTALVLIANALAPAATHITGFVEEGGGRPGGLVDTFLNRLGIGWDLLMRNPFAFVPVVGVLACLWLVLRPPRPIRVGLERYPHWRTALLVIILGSMVAYLVNDTGPAAAGLGFGLAIGGLFYVPLAEEPVKMER